jgi:hypothetical protein
MQAILDSSGMFAVTHGQFSERGVWRRNWHGPVLHPSVDVRSGMFFEDQKILAAAAGTNESRVVARNSDAANTLEGVCGTCS